MPCSARQLSAERSKATTRRKPPYAPRHISRPGRAPRYEAWWPSKVRRQSSADSLAAEDRSADSLAAEDRVGAAPAERTGAAPLRAQRKKSWTCSTPSAFPRSPPETSCRSSCFGGENERHSLFFWAQGR